MIITDSILGKKELMDITGLSQPAAIKRWLDDHRIKYTDRADGWPRTTLSAYNRALTAPHTISGDGFNLGAI